MQWFGIRLVLLTIAVFCHLIKQVKESLWLPRTELEGKAKKVFMSMGAQTPMVSVFELGSNHGYKITQNGNEAYHAAYGVFLQREGKRYIGG